MEVHTMANEGAKYHGGRICWQIPNKWGIPHMCIKGKWVEAQKDVIKKCWVPCEETCIVKSIKKMAINDNVKPIKKIIKKSVKKI